MSSSETPAVTYSLPSDSEGGQAITDTLHLIEGNTVRYSENDEAPDDVRNTLYDAISHEFEQQMAGWDLLPRSVAHQGAFITIEMQPVFTEYEDEAEVGTQDAPRKRVIETLREWALEYDEREVPVRVAHQECPGDESTITEAIERLKREGELYQPAENRLAPTHGWER